MDVGQAVVATLILERHFAVIDSHAMQDRGVQIVDVYRITSDVVAEVIRFTMCDAGFDSTAGQPDGKTTRMMVSTVIVGG